MDFIQIDIIAGPTASGKSALALERAAACNGVIINADSMQIYDALPILTARPALDDLRAVLHRLYGVLPPDEPCSAARWRSLAIAEIEQALAAGQRPIIVGGTGFYIKALVEGLSPMPDIPPDKRDHAMAMQADLGNPAFHAALAIIDPIMAARLHPNDTQRLVRAYEVMTATGQSLATWQSAPREGPSENWRFDITLVMPDRDRLYAQCDRRFDQMMDRGVLDEVRSFSGTGSLPVEHALGYRPLRRYLSNATTREQAIIEAKAETRHYAKRQATWFRHQFKSFDTAMLV